METRIIDAYLSYYRGRRLKTQVVELSHRDLVVGAHITFFEDGYRVSARAAGSDRFLLLNVDLSKDKFPSRKALYEYILTLAKTYGKN